ncbi:MAG: DASS family sodium-coupled anion symporter [Chthoniobacterales bacterium]|nr:DASS family sodium-coupled anion symporter [Chthoniobacterales bacterium]
MNQAGSSPGTKFAGGWGLAAASALLVFFPLASPPEGLSVAGWRTAGVALAMAVLWVTEAIPIPATALLPIVLFPLLGVASVKEAAAPFANPVIYLFMGGFFLALGCQRWRLHQRIALHIIGTTGSRVTRVLGGVMASTAFISMWVSNSATAVMMLPIALSLVALLREHLGDANARATEGLGIAMMLGVAYASNIGGMGTLVGTPPNALLAGFISETYGFHIGFGRWMLVGVPLVIVGTVLTHAILVRLCLPDRTLDVPGLSGQVRSELSKLGPLSRGEIKVASVFLAAAFCWVAQPLFKSFAPGVNDTTIAMGAAILLFCLPVNWRERTFVLGWEDVREFPWGVLVLMGGGLSMAEMMDKTGLAAWLGTLTAAWQGFPILLVVLMVTAAIVFLSELASNTATAATFLPVVASVSLGMGQNPLLLAIPATLAASCAFMLPVGTPPNAVAYATGFVPLPRMLRIGLWINFLFIVLIPMVAFTLAAWVFGIVPGQMPPWAPK